MRAAGALERIKGEVIPENVKRSSVGKFRGFEMTTELYIVATVLFLVVFIAPVIFNRYERMRREELRKIDIHNMICDNWEIFQAKFEKAQPEMIGINMIPEKYRVRK